MRAELQLRAGAIIPRRGYMPSRPGGMRTNNNDPNINVNNINDDNHNNDNINNDNPMPLRFDLRSIRLHRCWRRFVDLDPGRGCDL